MRYGGGMSPYLVIVLVVVAYLAAWALAAATYTVGSFVLGMPHLPPRPFGRVLASMAREFGWAMAIWPSWPLFYLLGRRLAPGDGRPVVCVHGYCQNRSDFVRIARALRAAGIGPVYAFNFDWTADIRVTASRLERFVDRVLAETGAAGVDLACHSMGGLVASEMMAARPGLVERCVFVATGQRGVQWANLILLGLGGRQLRHDSDYLRQRAIELGGARVLSIASEHDNIVHPVSSCLLEGEIAGARDVVTPDHGHLTLLCESGTVRELVAFLAEGRA